MTELAQVYVHLRPYDVDAKSIDRLGNAVREHAVAAARSIYHGNVTIDIRLEEGTIKVWATVIGVLGVLHVGYGVIADYKGFKEGVVAVCEDAQKFATFVSDHFVKDAAATPLQTFRVERRLKVPGKIRRVIVELEKLENAQLTEPELSSRLAEVRRNIAQIERTLGAPEIDGLNQILVHFESLKQPEKFPPPSNDLTSPHVAIMTELPTLKFERKSIAYTDSRHVWQATDDVSGHESTKQTFHQSVFVPAVDGGGDEKGKAIRPLLV
jgi:hypothetical protein